MERIRFVIASGSYLLAKGMHLLVNEIRNTHVVELVNEAGDVAVSIEEHQPQVLFVSSDIANALEDNDANVLQNRFPELKWIVLEHQGFPMQSTLRYNCVMQEFASKAKLSECLHTLVSEMTEQEKQEDELLSEREQMVLKQVAMGLTNKEIAEKLFISQHTVITHRKKITQKLGIKTISGLTVYAIINDLIAMEDIEQN